MAKKNQYVFKKAEGRGTVDTTQAPSWWLSDAEEGERFLRSLKGVKVNEIGRSSAGYPIICAEWGQRHVPGGRTSVNLSSAYAGENPAAFYGGKPEDYWGEGPRKWETFLFVGNAHGLEYEGTVAALNMLNVIANGKDLRGRRWPRLQEAARKMRFLIIPHLNMDGRMRYGPIKHKINVAGGDFQRIFFGERKNGEKYEWRPSHLHCPIPADDLSTPMGCYFNDNGMNLWFDYGFTSDLQPETQALRSLLRTERPHFVMLSHSNGGSLVGEPSISLPDSFQVRQAQLSALVGLACKTKKLAKHPITQSYDTKFCQCDWVYQTCGALPVLFEFPCGWSNVCGSFDEILDIGMTGLEEIVCFGAAYGFLPGM